MPADRSVEIAQLEARIQRQRERVDALVREGDAPDAQAARAVLTVMVGALETMRGGAPAPRADARTDDVDPLDERSLEAVMRECPL